MALLRLQLKNHQRGRRSIASQARYVTRFLAEHVKHNARSREGERPKEDLIAAAHQHMPVWAQAQPLDFWDAAERYSRDNACLAKELIVTLPSEFSAAQNLTLLQEFLATLPACPTSWAMHAPTTRDGSRTQYHAHILLSPRQDRGQGQDPTEYFKRAPRGVPARRLWTNRQEVMALRRGWETLLESHLKTQGLEITRSPHRLKELRLSWKEMSVLKSVIQRDATDAWGHEEQIPETQRQAWVRTKAITQRQALWLSQRKQKYQEKAVEQAREPVWRATEKIDKVSRWQVFRRKDLKKARDAVQKRLTTLEQWQRQTVQDYKTVLQPALVQAKARYRAEKQQERQRSRGRGRDRDREMAGRGVGLEVDVATLDRQRGRERD